MAYDPRNAINNIYKFKEAWNNANNSGNTKAKNDAAKKAQEYYKQLRNNGYESVANDLNASDYLQAKAIKDKWDTYGKTPTRKYMYSLGESKGMSQGDVDKLIGWDGSTGEVSFGGKKIGRPDAVVNGTSYWKDTTALDNAFNDYVSRSAITRPKETTVNQENENLFKKLYGEYDDLKKTNPFTTDEAKAILSKYDLSALQARDNEVASAAGSNGGNIDSFAAANALRQQAALVNQGQMTVLDSYKQKLDHARNLLSDIGVHIDRVYNQDETTKNNDVARKSEIASVTGYTPSEWSIKNDSFLKNFVDDNGKLKSEYENVDFQALVNNAKANGNTELANKYAILRGLKIFNNFGKYGKYLNEGDIAYVGAQPTEERRQFDEQIDQADRALNANMLMNDANNAASYAEKALAVNASKSSGRTSSGSSSSSGGSSSGKPLLTAAQATAAVKNGEITQGVIDAYNYWYGGSYTVDNPPKLESSGKNGDSKPPLTEKQVTAWVEYLNNDIAKKYNKNGEKDYKALKENGKNLYKRADADADYIIINVLGSSDLTQEQKEYLLYDKFGITEDEVNAALKDKHYN